MVFGARASLARKPSGVISRISCRASSRVLIRHAPTSMSPKLSRIRSAHTTTSVDSSQSQASLQEEIKSLQALLRQSQTHQEGLESLTRGLAKRTSSMEAKLDDINRHVDKISGMEKVITSVRDFLHDTPAVRGVVDNLETLVSRSRPYLRKNKYIFFGALAVTVVIWKYRSNLVYERTSEEVADLARLTLEQESLRLSIQETLHTIANSPSTLTTLNELLQSLIRHERTQQDLVNLLIFAVNTPEVQAALLDLLQVVFKDEELQKLTGEFLLKGLDEKSVKKMLDDQTAELVRQTVADDSVQQATAVGLQRSLLYSITPSFFWRLLERKDQNTNGEDEAERETPNKNENAYDTKDNEDNEDDESTQQGESSKQ